MPLRAWASYQHILISTDGSDVAQKGVDHGLTLAKGLDAKLTVLTVTERPPVYAGIDGGLGVAYDGYSAGQKEAAEKVLAAAKEASARIGQIHAAQHS